MAFSINLPKFQFGKDSDKATSQFSEMCLTALYPNMPELVGGSANLAPSNLTHAKDTVNFQRDSPEGRYFWFCVREHGIFAVTNGIFAYGGLCPFCATFLTFAGYCMGATLLSFVEVWCHLCYDARFDWVR
jgi:transketolase